MAGDGWVADIIWHAMILVGKMLVNFWRSWSMEFLLGLSFLMQLVLNLLAGFRWRGASALPRWVIWLCYVGGGASAVLEWTIWLCYVGADYVPKYALGNLSVSGSSGERQLAAFWAPFFLLHLGGPDSITAYQLEDNELSGRSIMEFFLQVVGTLYVIYYVVSGSRALMLATCLMFLVGVAKYVERLLGLHRANLGNLSSSLMGQQRHAGAAAGGRRNHHQRPAFGGVTIDRLMTAHSLFYICKHAFVDSSVEENLDEDAAAEKKKELFSLEAKYLFEVMEMELSLMYDFLYTKAAVIHTSYGYCIRALSPFATAAAFVLVELSNRHDRHRQSDVWTTRVLVAATFILETVSLVRTLGSSWTGFLIYRSRLRPAWIRHQLACKSRWERFRRAVASLGLANVQDHRRWSGNMDQLNMLKLATCGQRQRKEFWAAGSVERCAWNIKIGCLKTLVYKRVEGKVRAFRNELKGKSSYKTKKMLKLAANLRTDRGWRALDRHKLLKLKDYLGPELQLGILTWHIGTDIYLHISDNVKASKGELHKQVEAIRTLSNYMMYLLALRPDMLPGLVTRGLFQLTCEGLHDIWTKSSKHSPINRQEQLARVLHDKWGEGGSGDEINTYLATGIELGRELIKLEKEPDPDRPRDMVKAIFDVWVDMLFHAGYRCSKESHAKRLAHGGELTTIVWLLAEHAGLFIDRKTSKKKGGRRPSNKGNSIQLEKSVLRPNEG
ncbi:hypothetical protein BAE44_0004369 [Dichanthelium oligosanthes]|uniref:DUF4220 domain-containing protein n=1 Tax=Dichanthelium oligosanthes TaxID=888268 RepID=A0A1E5WB25_9POAL|nr:hypothetical protein BAE44_0004369 [Dichanthelium oligosanthes]